jgi:hypothetical protein
MIFFLILTINVIIKDHVGHDNVLLITDYRKNHDVTFYLPAKENGKRKWIGAKDDAFYCIFTLYKFRVLFRIIFQLMDDHSTWLSCFIKKLYCSR